MRASRRALRQLGVALGVALTPSLASAQSTRQLLDSAQALYEAFQIEAARPILQRITSANFLQVVTPSEKARALKYLGASAAVLSTLDSAASYFVAALDNDPFIDLEVGKFTAVEQAAFSMAKTRIFKAAIRPIEHPRVVQKDTAEMSMRFDFITTQRANVRMALEGPQDTVVLFDGQSDGLRSVTWRGLTNSNDRYVGPGTYQLRLRAEKAAGQPEAQNVSPITLRIEQVHEPLQEELPALDPRNPDHLLPETIRPSEPWWDLAKGVGLALVAIGVPAATLDSDIKWAPHAAATGVVALAGAGISYWFRRANPQIRANVAENAIRRKHRDDFNAAVRVANQRRLEQMKLVVTPASVAQ